MADDHVTAGRGTGDRMVDLALRGAIGAARRLPYERRVAAMGRLTAHALGPLAGYRRRAERNLGLIWPEISAPRRAALSRDVCDNLGRTLIENYSGEEFARVLPGTLAQDEGLDTIARARADRRPVLFVTGHFGNHEAPRRVLSRMGYEIGGLYRPMSNGFVNDHYAATMQGVSGPVFAKGRRGLTGFLRHLKSGGMATILFDLHDQGGSMIDFLGRPARTALTAAELALRFDAPLVPYFGIRRPDGIGFDIALEAPIPPDEPLEMMREATRRLEAHVLRDPGQWFWVHNRWKANRPRSET
ncbi:lysophospholipid acyltransferase family protein [Limimaricola litoreus]|uniref:Lysophospholipid acyltransferase family protein n=1 Tax=Limimaricola litoreus TaxID=2955316 RepID=A0A9X2JPN5_9RHOB|nr:lysophospholipid acyltransferase family protein [Limimaricola litoreus]MCP1169798.1 lysophospholipid acyltransferase family protein [Limimaricola litoreus]